MINYKIYFFALLPFICAGQANFISDAFIIARESVPIQSECDFILLNQGLCEKSNKFKKTAFFKDFLNDMLKNKKMGLGYPKANNPFFELPANQLDILRNTSNWKPLACVCHQEVVISQNDCEVSLDTINEVKRKYGFKSEIQAILFNQNYSIYVTGRGNLYSATVRKKSDNLWRYMFGKSNIPFSDE